MRGSELGGKAVGIVGFGAIGRRVARLVSAFDASILVYDPFLDPKKIKEAGAKPVELDELMNES